MLTIRQNLLETIHGGHPDRFVNQYEFLKIIQNPLGNHNPRLHTDETLIALSISAATDPAAEEAMKQLARLKNCEAHSSVILSQVDVAIFKKLGINLTQEPTYQTKKLYHK